MRLRLFGLILFLIYQDVKAQGLPVGTPVLEEYYRRMQLLGQVDSTISFMARPLLSAAPLNAENVFDPDSTLKKASWNRSADRQFEMEKVKGRFKLLPFSIQGQYNSHHPYGWNDGGMIPSRGYQQVITGGIFAEFGPLSVRLQPEIVYAGNTDFDQFPTEHYDAAWVNYYRFYNNIDQPERFGESSYKKILAGQSSIRINFDPVSVGYSTENLWWGPGIRSSLLMSNTAPGFRHFTLNTIRPVKTAIGSIEGQLIVGRLDSSGYTPPEPNRTFRGVRLYNPKPNDWRYITGLVFSYQPKWIPGLFLGFTRTLQLYHKDQGNGIGDHLPLFAPFQPFKADRMLKPRDQMGSVFARWMFKEAKAELYAEYGRKDQTGTLSDLSLSPERSRAYIVGLQKLVPLRRDAQFVHVRLELTQLQQSVREDIQNADSWYTDPLISHGYTHRGEVVGAGIGPGSNLQSLGISWVRGLKQIGLQLERYVHNNDFYYYTFGDIRIHWVDVSAAATANWEHKNLLLNAQLGMVRSLNYQWWYREYGRSDYYAPGRDVLNFHGQLGVSYRF